MNGDAIFVWTLGDIVGAVLGGVMLVCTLGLFALGKIMEWVERRRRARRALRGEL